MIRSFIGFYLDQSAAATRIMTTASEFKNGMRRLSGAVNIITTLNQGVPAGMTATAVCSLTADPPILLVCVNKGATSHDPIKRSGRFTVNVLSADDIAVAQQFCIGDMDARFKVGDWSRLASGGLALRTALVTFDCALMSNIPIETHSIFIGSVEEVIMQPERAPLVYINGQYAQVPIPTALQSVDS